VRNPKRVLFVLVAVLGVAVAALPALAVSESSVSIDAVNEGIYGHHWSPAIATIGPGGAITLSNPTEVAHGVEWVGGPATPACSAGVPVGKEPADSGKQWSGTCSFPTAGVYTFYCTVHGPEMTGRITVAADGTTTTTMTMPPTATTPVTQAPGTPGTGAGPEAPGAGGAPQAHSSPLAAGAGAVKLAASQHGSSVRGSVLIAAPGAGGTLLIELRATHEELAGDARTSAVLIGHARVRTRPGRVAFAVVLDSAARRALARAHRLRVNVKLVLTPLSGAGVSLVRSVVLHA
jgi:plastocyanin